MPRATPAPFVPRAVQALSPGSMRRQRRGRHAAPRAASALVLPVALATAAGAGLVGLTGTAPVNAAPERSAPLSASAATAWVPPSVADPSNPPASPQALAATALVQQRAQARASRERRLSRPVRPVTGPLTSPFGRRWGRLHAGVDFGVPVGTPVRAVQDGVAEPRKYDAGGYGNAVDVLHPDGTTTVYAHLSTVAVPKGPVLAGQVLGLSGNTGHSTGPHLHFEVRTPQGPTDPRPWLAALRIKI